MRKISLKCFAEEVGQAKAAMQLGVRQSAISKAIRSGRQVMVTITTEGMVSAEEVKSFPSQRREDACAQ